MHKRHFLWLFVLHAAILIYLAWTTPITPYEAKLFYYDENDFVYFLMHLGYSIIPHTFGIRIFFVLFAFASVLGYYYFLKRWGKQRTEVYLSVSLFMFLPGIIIAGSTANIGIIVLSAVIFFLLFYETKHFYIAFIMMLLLFFAHEASIVFFFALTLYALKDKDTKLFIISSSFFMAQLLLSRGIDIGGRPSGHFLDIFGLYATIFSPLLFLYFFYTMYRILLRGEHNIVWYISFTALVISLLLSLRQRVYITDFAPYVMIAVFLMVETFQKSLKVRLPSFRKPYYFAFIATLSVMAVTILIAVTASLSYRLSGYSSQHFAARIYAPYYLAQQLKQKSIDCLDVTGRKALQLRFYGIPACSR